MFTGFYVVSCQFGHVPLTIGMRDEMRDEPRRSSLLKVTFPSQKIGERILVEMMSGGRSRLPPRERSNAINSQSGALTPGNRLGLDGHHESLQFPDLT